MNWKACPFLWDASLFCRALIHGGVKDFPFSSARRKTTPFLVVMGTQEVFLPMLSLGRSSSVFNLEGRGGVSWSSRNPYKSPAAEGRGGSARVFETGRVRVHACDVLFTHPISLQLKKLRVKSDKRRRPRSPPSSDHLPLLQIKRSTKRKSHCVVEGCSLYFITIRQN